MFIEKKRILIFPKQINPAQRGIIGLENQKLQ